MKTKMLSAPYLSSLCLELHLILQAGISVSEGLLMLGEDEQEIESKKLLMGLYQKTDAGQQLHTAMREAAIFPDYLVDMVEIGERTGHLEQVMQALSVYYDRQEQISQSIRNAISYPAILLLMMLFVVGILIVKVLPIFNDVFLQLGSTMSPFASALMAIGTGLSRNWPVLVAVLALVAGGCLILARRSAKAAGGLGSGWLRGGRMGQAVATARLSAALAMTLSSGLSPEDSLEMAGHLAPNPGTAEKISECKKLIAQGEGFADAIAKAGVFSGLHCRMLSIGFKTGTADTVMSEIAQQSEQAVDEEMNAFISKVEPTLVILLSLITGLILLSVMLPLMEIMSSIG